MPIKIRGRTKYRSVDEATPGEGSNLVDSVKPHQKSKTLLWRLFSSSRRSIDNASPASQPGDIPSCPFESGAILEEEYQESFGLTGEHSESVPSILRKITPPHLSDSPLGSGAMAARHSAYANSRAHRLASANSPTAINTVSGIYNEPCDVRHAGNSSGTNNASVIKKAAFRRASLATSIYCDTEHHRQDAFQPPSSPQGSPDSLRLSASKHLRDASGSAGLTTASGRKNGNSQGHHYWRERDSGSSSLSTSRDVSLHNNPHFEMASPPAGSASSTGHSPLPQSGGSVRVHSQSPPPPAAQPHLLARDHRHRQQQAPLAQPPSSPGLERRRNLSPRQQTTTAASSSHSASPVLSNSPSFSNCPVVLQGNTQISHHPASPFAPIARTTPCGNRCSPPVATTAPVPSSKRSNSDVTAPACSCTQSYHRPNVSPPPDYQRVFCSSGAGVGAMSDPIGRQMPEDGKSEGIQPPLGVPRASRRRKDLAATYEEAWDVKMSRRLGGMDVSRLAEALPNGNFKRHDLVRASDRPLRSPAAATTVVRSPSLSPVLTSTEGIVMRQPRPAPRISFRNSSTDTVTNHEMMVSPFRFKSNRVASPLVNLSISPNPRGAPTSPSATEAPTADYDYAYNRSWSMGVQLNLSLNLASNADSSADQTVGTLRGEVSGRSGSPISGVVSPPPPPPHRSASIMTPTSTQFSPPQSPTPMRRLRAMTHGSATVSSDAGVSPPSSRARGVHNPLASGVPAPLTPSSPPSEESSSTMRGDTSDAASGATVAVPGLLPHMSRLLADWDNMSTDSCEEPWDIRHGKVISQLTSSRFIDPSEVLSAVANGNHNGTPGGGGGIGDVSNGHSEGRSELGRTTETEGVALMPPSLGISPPTSCASPLARSPSDVKAQNCLKPLNEQPWFHPNLTRVAAEKRLRSEPEGSFLVRNSETIKNEYSLTVKHNGFLHMRITRDAQGQFVLGEYSQPYPSIPHMISHYEQTQVPVKGADSVTLCHPR